jgi:type IV pilus assembly protein PilC
MLRDEEKLATTLFKIAEYHEAMAVSTTHLAYRLRTLDYFLVGLPILLILMVLLLICALPAVVVARIFGGSFPSLMHSVITLSQVFVTYWWLFSGSVLIVGGWLWIQRHSVILHVPLLGRLYRKMVLVRFLRTCAFMLSNNASLVEALQASTQAVDNPTYAKFLQQLTEQVTAGATLSEALLKQPAFPAKVAHAAAIGTQVNQLDKWFMTLAEVYTQRLYRDIASTIAFLEPIAVLAILAIGVLAMYIMPRSNCGL